MTALRFALGFVRVADEMDDLDDGIGAAPGPAASTAVTTTQGGGQDVSPLDDTWRRMDLLYDILIIYIFIYILIIYILYIYIEY